MIFASTSRPGLARFLAARALALACSAGAAGSAQESLKLSGALAQPLGGNVGYFACSPDGSRVVYVGDQEVDERFELYSVPSDGSELPIKISAPQHGNVHGAAARVTPDGTAIVYLTEEPALFRAPLDGSSAPVQLAGGIAYDFSNLSEEPFRLEISPDGQWVVYRENDPDQLLAVRADGSAPPVQLGLSWAVIDVNFRLSADGQRIVFRAGISDIKQALYSVPIDGSASPTRLNPGYFDARQTVNGFQLTPDSQTVVYSSDQDVPEVFEVYSVPIGGGIQTGFNGTLPAHADAYPVAITPDSARVLFNVDLTVNERYDLYIVPIDASAAPLRLSGTPPSIWPNGVLSTQLLPDGSRALYLTSGRELYGVPLPQGGTPLRLSPEGAVVLEYQVTSTGTDVVFQAYPEGSEDLALFSVPPDGGYRGRAARVPRVRRLATNTFTHFLLHPDGGRVTCLAQDPTRLLSLPVSGVGTTAVLATSYVGHNVLPGDRVIFSPLTPLEFPGSELFSIPISGGTAVRLNTDLPIGPVLGRIQDFQVSPDGEWAVYLADGDIRWRNELYAGPTDGSAPPIQISNETTFYYGDVGETDTPGAFRISPDSTRVAYVANHETAAIDDLYVAPIDGSAPALQLTQFADSGGARSGFQFTPDGQRALFLARVPVNQFSSRDVLYSVGLDGSAPAVLLGPPSGSVQSFAVSPDSAHVVFHTYETSTRKVLHSATTDGSTLVELQVATAFLADIGTFRISPDGARVVYLLHPDSGSSGQLYTIGVEGGPRQRFGGPGVSAMEFEVTEDGQHVVYSVEGFETYDLFRSPIDASASLRLNPPIPSGPFHNFPTFRVSPDGTRVAYLIDQEVDGQFGLYGVPTDGSQQVAALTAPLAPGASVWRDFRVSPDSGHALFLTDTADVGTFELYSVPMAGGSPAVRLNGPLASGNGFLLEFGDPAPIVLAGARVAYALDQEVAGQLELYVAPVDGGREGRKVNETLQGGTNDALPFVFADANRLVYLAPQDLPGVPEIFIRSLSTVPRHRRR